jgi:hypothetical protein
MKNIMVDLETLGKGSDAVIVAIGAVAFDETGLGSTFYTNVDPQSCVDVGMKIDAGTVMWWMGQSDAARKALATKGRLITDALNDFAEFIGNCAGAQAEVWGNGATFDNVILANAYTLAGVGRPWGYRNDRCYRTMHAMYPKIVTENVGTAHNALDDAIYQARVMSQILAHIKGANDAQVVEAGTENQG